MRYLKKGFAIPTMLLLLVIVVTTVALIGTLFVKAFKIQRGMKTHYLTLLNAETAARGLMDYISSHNGTLPFNCTTTTGLPCTQGCGSTTNCICRVDWNADSVLANLKVAVENATNVKGTLSAYLLRNCTSGSSTMHLMKVVLEGWDGDLATVYFAYNSSNNGVEFPLYFEY